MPPQFVHELARFFFNKTITSLANKPINFKINYFSETEYNLELFKKPQ